MAPKYQTLRELLRASDYRRFRAKNRQNRWADFLGFSADGAAVIGWFDGDAQEQRFAPDEREWSHHTTYY